MGSPAAARHIARRGQNVLYTIDDSCHDARTDIASKLSHCRRVLLIEANDQRRWVGGRVGPEVHIPPVGLMYVAASLKQHHPNIQIQILETSLEAGSDKE